MKIISKYAFFVCAAFFGALLAGCSPFALNSAQTVGAPPRLAQFVRELLQWL
jgi:hypothetical protein